MNLLGRLELVILLIVINMQHRYVSPYDLYAKAASIDIVTTKKKRGYFFV